MSFTFTKLFSSITESTVWMEPSNIRIVWITMLSMADRKGRVWASIPGLANRARVPVDDCRHAIEVFIAPDPDSRTPDFEGRRIEQIEGGWRLLNHEKYRNIRDEESIKEAKRKYINERRARERMSKNTSTVDSSRSQSIQAEAEAEAEAEANTKTVGSAPALTDDDWIKSLVNDPAFRGIAVETEIAKCMRWCETNRKKCSRRRIINWLNRAERPIQSSIGVGAEKVRFNLVG